MRGEKSAVESSWRKAVHILATDVLPRRRHGEAALKLAEGRNYQCFLDWFEAYLESVAADRQL